MEKPEAVIAVFADHAAAEAAVKKLNIAGFDIKNLSVVGKGYHLDEQVVGFYNQGDRIRFWGTRGAFWGGLWTLFFGGVVLTLPAIGPVVALGYLAAAIVAAVEGAVAVGGFSAIAAALYGLGIPKDSVLHYETAIKVDSFLVMVHDTPSRIALAKGILETANPSRIDVHTVDDDAASLPAIPLMAG
jgi:hypothetical protein